MARYGITYQAVAQAAQEIAQNNRQPTVEQVRRMLGTGSSTTIANHLRQWRKFQELTPELAGKEQIPAELLIVLKTLWEKTLINVHQTLSISASAINKPTVDLKQECEKYKQNNQRWQKLFEQWQTEKIRLDREIELLRDENHVLKEEQEQLKHQLQQNHVHSE